MAPTWMRRGLIAAGALIVAGYLAFAYMRHAPRHTPPGQPSLLHLAEGDLSPLQEAFDSRADSFRVLVLLSPT